MPFKSKAQQRFMFAAEDRGEIPKGTAKRWAKHTRSIKSLPEQVKEAVMSCSSNFQKIAEELKKYPPVTAEEKMTIGLEAAKDKKLKGMSPAEKRKHDVLKKNNMFARNSTTASTAS